MSIDRVGNVVFLAVLFIFAGTVSLIFNACLTTVIPNEDGSTTYSVSLDAEELDALVARYMDYLRKLQEADAAGNESRAENLRQRLNELLPLLLDVRGRLVLIDGEIPKKLNTALQGI